jgi:pimeloyl-ACP methyl ester carboxylesterase
LRLPSIYASPSPRLAVLTALFLIANCAANGYAQPAPAKTTTVEVPFTSHDGHAMFGKLTLPESGKSQAVVVYVQTAEGMTVDMKRPKSRTETFHYFDLYREKLPEMGVGFFSYEGRGIRLGDSPPRYEKIEPEVYNTSTLENKVRDVLSAVAVVKKQPGLEGSRVFLMGASEGTLLAAEAASRVPKEIGGLILYGVLASNMRENFRYILTDGAFLVYRGFFDTDKDGKISKAEFEADPRKYREAVFKNADFRVFDPNGDGFFTADEMQLLSKTMIEAVDKENYEILDRWAKTAAGVTTPPGWFKDHFAHPPIWTFLSKLEIPVGFFHGSGDTNTPIEGVRKLEEQAKKAGKAKMEFHYFEGLDHSLNVGSYFTRGTLPEGHQAIFTFVKKHVAEAK